MSDLYLHSPGNFYRANDGESLDLKSLVAEAVGQPVRRIGRFIQLALIGAGQSAKAAALPASTAVYLASARGDLEITIEVMQSLLRDGHAPKPLSFINTVSNAACFYIANSLKLTGRSSFICNRYFAFESVLQLAALDVETNAVTHALLGAVDVVVPPLAEHRQRLGLDTEAPVADASHWLCLSKARPAQGNACRLLACEFFADRETLLTWCRRNVDSKACAVSAGQFLADDEYAELTSTLGMTHRFAYRTDLAYYDSQSGAAISAFMNADTKQSELLHVNRDPSGRYGVMWVKRI